MSKRSGRILIAAGALLLAAALGLTLYNRWDSDRAGRESERALETLQSVILQDPLPAPYPAGRGTSRPDAGPENPAGIGSWDSEGFVSVTEEPGDAEEPEVPEMPAVQIEQWTYIGVLEIPSLRLTLPVLSKWDNYRLRVSPCRFYGSVYTHNLVICGHNYRSHFSPVRSIETGAEVLFIDMSGIRYRYTVAATETLEPEQVSEMIRRDETWDLTLFTCNPGGTTRFAVRCKETEEA